MRVSTSLLLAGLLASSAAAQDPPAADPPAAEADPSSPARSFETIPDAASRLPPNDEHPEWDWIVLDSRERLGGRLLRLRDGEVTFASHGAGERTVAWSRVRAYLSPRPKTYVTRTFKRVRGTAFMLPGGPLRVHTEYGEERIARDQLLGILSATRELERWSLDVAVGLNFVDGTTDQAAFSSTTRLQRRGPLTRLLLTHAASYGTTRELGGESVETVNNQTGSLTFEVFLVDSFALIPVSATLGYDRFQNLDLRGTIGAGLGLDIEERPVELQLQLTGNYQYTAFVEVEPGRQRDESGGGATLVTHFEWAIASGLELDFDQRSALVYNGESFARSTFRTSAGLALDLFGSVLDLGVRFTWDRILEPEPLQDGDLPQADTFTLILSVGLDLN